MKINDVEFNAELSEILDELVAQLRANNIQLIQKRKETVNHIQICCPYHKDGMERRPSAGIRKSDGIFHCFTCGEVHSLQEVISYCFGYRDDLVGSFGWNWLLKNFISVQIEERKDVVLDFARTDNNNNSRVDRKFVTEEELDKYRYIHPYMYKRRLTDDIIEMFDIGYDSSTKTITFPVKDIKGNVLFVARRSVVSKFFNYPVGVVKPLYGLYELYQLPKFPDEVIVCESMLDALTCWVYGKYAVAMNGLGNELQFRQLRELPCRKLILATDNDEAGRKARKRIRKNVSNKIIMEYELPEGKKDINELDKSQFLGLKSLFFSY